MLAQLELAVGVATLGGFCLLAQLYIVRRWDQNYVTSTWPSAPYFTPFLCLRRSAVTPPRDPLREVLGRRCASAGPRRTERVDFITTVATLRARRYSR